MKKIIAGCALGLLGLPAHAQDEPAAEAAPVAETAEAPATEAAGGRPALAGRYFLSPALSWAFADSGRQTDDGYGASLALGRGLNDEFVLEAFTQWQRFDHEQGSDSADLLGLGVNSLFFPARRQPAYLLLGAGYADVSSHPGGDADYGALLLNVGGGYWWEPFNLGFLRNVRLRTDALWRLDAHNDSRTGVTSGNGRKDFQDVVLNLGLSIPVGAVPEPPPPAPEPVSVVATAAPLDSDGDGVPDDLDQCPGTPAGTAVDANGCPAASTTCKSPEPGETLDLSGCGTGDVVVLKGVNFEFDRDRLTAEARGILDGVSQALKAAATTNVEVGGHTDARGTDAYNQRLSERRACNVGRYLADQGVEASRLSTVGHGESKPVADNETDEGREQNRRVELRVLDSAGTGLTACAAPVATASAVSAPEPGAAPEAAAPASSASDAAPVVEAAPEAAVPEATAAEAPAPQAPANAGEASMHMVPESEVF